MNGTFSAVSQDLATQLCNRSAFLLCTYAGLAATAPKEMCV
jgi:hypothetical protein